MRARRTVFRRSVFQALAALVVGVSGFASLGTSDCETGYTTEAERPVEFSPEESEHLVSVRFSSSNFQRLVVTTAPGVPLVQIDPPPEASGTGGSATDAAPTAPASEVVIERRAAEISEVVLRVDRGDRVGAFSVAVAAALTGESCNGPPALDVRVDVVD